MAHITEVAAVGRADATHILLVLPCFAVTLSVSAVVAHPSSVASLRTRPEVGPRVGAMRGGHLGSDLSESAPTLTHHLIQRASLCRCPLLGPLQRLHAP